MTTSISTTTSAPKQHHQYLQKYIPKKIVFLGLCPKLCVGLRPKIGVAVGGWGSRVPNKYMEFCPKNCSFFQKKIKCSKQPKKQNKLNFLNLT